MKNRSFSDSFKKWVLSSILVLGLVALITGCTSPVGGGSGVTLNMKSADLVIGGPALQLTASRQVTWISSDPSVASVSSSGLVTALTKGEVTITASSGSSKATCAVHSNVLLLWGSVQTSDGPIPVYWKDNVLHTLPVGAGTQIYGVVNQAMVVGSDVYFSGYLTDTTNSTSTPVYWKNGVLNLLSVPSGYTYNSQWLQPNLDKSGTLYFRANLSLGDNVVPGEWVNGTWVQMNMRLPNGLTATSGSISCEYLDDAKGLVYVSGDLIDPQTHLIVPVYWTGIPGTVTVVSTNSLSPAASVSAIMGPPFQPVLTLLISGYETDGSPIPAYSVHGNVTEVPTGAATNAVLWWSYVDAFGNNYATGNAGTDPNFWLAENQIPMYWKNWQPIELPLPDGYTAGVENGAFEDTTGGLYFAGVVTNPSSAVPVYWFNGTVHPLPIDGYLGGQATGHVTGIDF